MSRKLPTNIASMSKAKVKEWLASFDYVLTDCDGVLWLYNDIIGKAPNVINKFVENGKKVFFITNNSTKTREEFAEKNKALNFNVGINGIISTAYLSALYLKQRNFDKKVYIIGAASIGKELDAVGISHMGVGPDPLTVPLNQLVNDTMKFDPDVQAVIVGFDEHFSFPKMVKAATYLDRPGSIFIGTNTDERFPLPKYVIPGTGTFVSCVETSAERKAIVMGKPTNMICDIFFKESSKETPKKFLMIGDRLNTDILFGKRHLFQTLFVESGVHKISDIEKIIHTLEGGTVDQDLDDQIPDYYIKELGDLLEYMV